MLHDLLWQLNTDLANACLEHPFVRRLADGSLDRGAFGRYIAQDTFFLREFLQGYAMAAAKCAGSLDQVRCFHKLMGGVLDELQLHSACAAKWRVDLSHVRPLRPTRAYTDFLRRTAWHSGVDEIVSAMVPCMRLYAFLGTELVEHRYAGHPFEEWITTYAGADFQALATELEAVLDAVANDTANVRYVYRYAMQCELDFFAAPLEDAE